VPSETFVPINGDRDITNPDDPDGDQVEAIAWWDPDQLPGNPAVRPELLASLPDVLTALGVPPSSGDEAVCPCGLPAAYDPIDGWQHTDGSIGHDDGESVSDKMPAVAKAAAGKGDALAPGAHWPGWDLDQRCADHWAPLIATALTRALSTAEADRLARAYLTENSAADARGGKKALNAAAAAWLADQGLDLATPLTSVLESVFTDAYLIGITSAHAMVDGGRPKVGAWTPGDTAAAREVIDSLNGGDGLDQLLATVPDEAQAIADGCLRDLGRQLADSAIAATSTVTKGRIGNALRGRLADIRRAASTALTAITRGSGRAAVTTYAARGVAMGQWLIDPGGNVCPTCEANAAAGLVPIGQPFPSGDPYPPAHPNCRCALANA
jgi:hypothetical protein